MVQPVWAVIFLEPQPYMNDSFIISSEIFLDHRATTSWHHGSSRDSYIAHTHRILPRYTHGISRNYWSEYVASCGRKNNTITVTRWRNSYKNRANQDRKELANYEFRQYINWFEPRCPINATIPRSSKACWKILRFQIFSLFSLWTVMWTMDFEGFPAINLHFRWIKQKKHPFARLKTALSWWICHDVPLTSPFRLRFHHGSPLIHHVYLTETTTEPPPACGAFGALPCRHGSGAAGAAGGGESTKARRIQSGGYVYMYLYIYIYLWMI